MNGGGPTLTLDSDRGRIRLGLSTGLDPYNPTRTNSNPFEPQYLRNVRVEPARARAEGRAVGRIRVTPWKRSRAGPPITKTSPERRRIGRVGSRRRQAPRTNRAVSPSETDTIGTPASIVSRRSSLSWCTPMRLPAS